MLALYERAIKQALPGAHDADRTRDLVLTKDVLYQLSYVGIFSVKRRIVKCETTIEAASLCSFRRFTIYASRLPLWSGRWDLNPRQPAWKAGTLPLSYARPSIQC